MKEIMSRRTIANFCALPSALFLLLIGILHSVVNVSGFRRALARGDVAAASRRLTAVRKQTTQLGAVPLRLQWLQLELAVATRSGNAVDAVARYRETAALLKSSGRYRDAWLVYALGARALGSNRADADAARDAAESARKQLLADTPEASRESLRQLLQRRWLEESGSGDGH